MPSCAALNCINLSSRGSGKSFFRFPLNNDELCKKWVIAMTRDNWQPTKFSRLCSDHFQEKCFRYKNELRKLQPNSVPNIFESSDYLRGKNKSDNSLPLTCSNLQADVTVEPLNKKKIIATEHKDETQNEDSRAPSVSAALHDHAGYHVPSSSKVREQYFIQKMKCAQLRQDLKVARLAVKRLKIKIEKLKRESNELRRNRLPNKPTDSFVTEHGFSEVLQNLLTNHLKGFKNNKYPTTLKNFALTMNCYSSKAYAFMGKFIKLPHPRTLRQWAAEERNPEFSEGSYQKITSEVDRGSDMYASLDELAVEKQLNCDGTRLVGHFLENEASDNEDVL